MSTHTHKQAASPAEEMGLALDDCGTRAADPHHQPDRSDVRHGAAQNHPHLRIVGHLPRAGVHADRGSGKTLAQHTRRRQNRTVVERHGLQGRCTGAGRSAGSAESRRLTHHAPDQPYTRFDFISIKKLRNLFISRRMRPGSTDQANDIRYSMRHTSSVGAFCTSWSIGH